MRFLRGGHHGPMTNKRVAICGRGNARAQQASSLVQLLGIDCEPTSHGPLCEAAAVVIDTQGLHRGGPGVLPVGEHGLDLPGDEVEFLAALDKVLHPEAGRLLAVFGRAGGVGASTMTTAIARIAARRGKVAILDCADPPSLYRELTHSQGAAETTVAGLAALAGGASWRGIVVAQAGADWRGHALALARKVGSGGLVVIDAGRVGGRCEAEIQGICDQIVPVGSGRWPKVRGGQKFRAGPLLGWRIHRLVSGLVRGDGAK